MAISDVFTKVGRFAGDNSSGILTGIGVTGVVTTAIFSGRASFKAAQLIAHEEAQMKLDPGDLEGSPALSTKDKVKLVWPLYIPPVAVGVTTIAAILMANHEASKKIAALTVASSISERTLQEYKAKVIERFGDKKEVEIRDAVAQERVNKTPMTGKETIIVENGDVLCFDMHSGRYFHSSMEKLRRAENKINFEILNHMYASLSSFYDEIGLAPTSYSDDVGWNGNELFEISFSSVISPDGRPCIAFDFARAPFAEYARLW
jgi:hypothetical protein